MPHCTSVHFGSLEYSEEHTLEFPEGLPAFEQERWFLPVEREAAAPFLFLQSLRRPELAFLTLPVSALQPSYQLELAEEDREKLGLPPEGGLEIGRDVVCLAIVTVRENRATANLLAPIVINPAARRAIQFIQADIEYPLEHPLPGWGGEAACS
jgi:flagellar assembly factor FliW